MHFSIAIGAGIAFFAALELWLRYEAAHRGEMPGAPSKN
jgi:hypothetical protein